MYFFPYIIVALIILFLYFNECGQLRYIQKEKAQWLAFAIMLIFMGLRGHIYSDFINYYVFYENLPNIFNLSVETFTEERFEPGFVLYSSIVKTIMPNYFGWVFINTLIDMIVFWVTFKRYTHSQILPFVFFLAFNGLLIEFNLYRNIKAIDLFLLSLPYLQNRKWMPYMLLNLLGMSFHMTSLIYLPLYFVLVLKPPKYILWGGIVVANVIFLGQVHFIAEIINSLEIFQTISIYDKLVGYTDKSEASYGISFGYVERTFSMILFTILYEKLVNKNEGNVIFYNCFWLYYVLFLSLYEVQVFAERIPTLFMFSYWILYPNVIKTKFKYRQIVYVAVIVLSIMKIYLANGIPPAKYDNVIFGIDSYDKRTQIYENYLDS